MSSPERLSTALFAYIHDAGSSADGAVCSSFGLELQWDGQRPSFHRPNRGPCRLADFLSSKNNARMRHLNLLMFIFICLEAVIWINTEWIVHIRRIGMNLLNSLSCAFRRICVSVRIVHDQRFEISQNQKIMGRPSSCSQVFTVACCQLWFGTLRTPVYICCFTPVFDIFSEVCTISEQVCRIFSFDPSFCLFPNLGTRTVKCPFLECRNHPLLKHL